MTSDASDAARGASRLGCRRVLLCVAGVVVSGAIIAACAWFAVVAAIDTSARRAESEARELAARLRDRFVSVFQFSPKIVAGSTTLHAQSAERLELVTAEARITQDYTWSHVWLGSMKRFEIEGTFVARAGFNLAKPAVLRIDPAARTVDAILPAPEILSCEMIDLRVRRDEDGLWNKLTEAERNDAIRSLLILARNRASKTDAIARARRSAKARLAELLRSHRFAVRVVFSPATESAPP